MFGSSELGTKEYWDSVYETEITNFNTIGDVGEIWFGESKERQAVSFCNNVLTEQDHTIMDIGCGNGHLSVTLCEEIDKRPLKVYAFDYSQNAIELSRSLFDKEGLTDEIHLEELDITIDIEERWRELIYIAIDKGTYDAISLCPEQRQEKLCKYRENIYNIIKPNGYLMIFSCNWTEDELLDHFIRESNNWCHHKTFPSPSFNFGGKIGKNVTGVVFKRI